jgi:hypothetical protein
MPKQRQVRKQQQVGTTMETMRRLEARPDEELEAETRHRSAAMAILGARAAERYDVKKTRRYFERAITAARPQDRMQIRRMYNASLALAQRRPDALKSAVAQMGQAPPSRRALFGLRVLGLIAPTEAGWLRRTGGILLVIVAIAVVIGIGTGIVYGISQPIGGGLPIGQSAVLGVLLAIAVVAVLTLLGRRRQKRLKSERAGDAQGQAAAPARRGDK